MANFHLQWTIEGEKELSRVLIGMGTSLKDYRQPFENSVYYLKKTFSKDVFATQGAAIGERWKRLSPATVAEKARRGFFGGPLIRTGRMQNSFASIVQSDQAVVYNTAEYFKYHQSNRARSFRLPRRVMMALGQNQRVTIVRYFQEFVREAMRR
jgi:phage gpG-like protein